MEIARHWRLKAQRYRLQGSLCPTCGRPSFPPRPFCPHCMTRVGILADSRVSLIAHSVAMAELTPSIRHPVTESTIG